MYLFLCHVGPPADGPSTNVCSNRVEKADERMDLKKDLLNGDVKHTEWRQLANSVLDGGTHGQVICGL